MDPLENIEEHVWWLIFQHFSVRDIIKVSMVSPLWNDLIGNSGTCMRKIWLRFYWPFENVELLKMSKRKYQNFKVQRKFQPFLYQIVEKYRWKQVMIRDFEIDALEFFKIITKLAPHIEELELWCVLLQDPDTKKITPLEFPKLQKLDWRDSSIELLKAFMGNNPRFKSIIFNGQEFVTKSQQESENILKTILKSS